MKFHGDAATDLDNKEIHKVGTYHTCLEEISLNSALNKNGNYYPQVFLNELNTFKKILGMLVMILRMFLIPMNLMNNQLE